MVRNPVTAHAPIRRAGEVVWRAISADTMKIPEPIMEPITSMVALVRPKPLTNSRSDAASTLTGIVFASVLNRAPQKRCRSSVVGLRRISWYRHFDQCLADDQRPTTNDGLQDFTLECAKIPLPILGGRAPDRILQLLSLPRLRSQSDN